MTIKVLIADDEPLLRQALIQELTAQMQDCEVSAEVGNGDEALEWLGDNTVDIAFLDIKMPGMTGLEVAQALLERESASQADYGIAPMIVFVTAYDEYAVEAFEAAAVDYLLKPVTEARLQKTVQKIQERMVQRKNAEQQKELKKNLECALKKLSINKSNADFIRTINVGIGDQIRFISVEDIILFMAEDKYVSVYTECQHALIREPLKDLLTRLPRDQFVQIHRSTVVNMAFVDAAKRDATGKMTLIIRGIDVEPIVSRSNRHLFKAI